MAKHISVLVPERAILGSLEGSRQIFTQVNTFFQQRGEDVPFVVELVGLKPTTRLTGGIFTANHRTLDEVPRTDLIIIPALDGDLQDAIQTNSAFIPWIQQQHAQGAEVASLCLGAFLLASTGLLKGRRCATHWLAENQFRQMFPDIELVAEKVITDEGGLYSSGGAFSYLNLILYLVEKYAGHEMAVLAAKVFAIEIERESQLSFTIFQGQKTHGDPEVLKAQEYIEKAYSAKHSVDSLADMLAIGRRAFERRFKKATANTVAEYIQRVKIEAAKKTLESSRKNVTDAMYDVGYSDTKAFRTTFKKFTGLSPIEYRAKFRELAAG